MAMSEQTLSGGCHCGAVRFEVDAPRDPEVWSCNCSICGMTGFRHLIVEKSRFRLLAGQAKLTSYRFGSGVAQHLFCGVCGVKSFYVPRSHPDGFSVNTCCLDGDPLGGVEPRAFDGEHWEQNAGVFSEGG
jgi:hypothetical protein